ncbi:hypothetical protein T459_29790 [Capsicum annuum]|uniref:Single-stranded DNA binding protein Ssb-like OB fold domain-containing protein n=1 Tax=Capsicum annuum TaxID=4072 RepID=A0A2G2Y6H3_CAPAN|nr:hypothetical protein T459_29790 [Capsicum annuum]
MINTKMVVRGNQIDMSLAECLVGDETGMTNFTARNNQGIQFDFSFFFFCNSFGINPPFNISIKGLTISWSYLNLVTLES